MLRLGWRAQLDYGLAGGGACFDPGTLLVTSLAASAIGGGLSAASTIAGGNYAAKAGEMQRNASYAKGEQLDQNAAQALASGQRQMFDTQEKSRLAISTAQARGAASGVNIAVGSPIENEGELAKRGSYHALMDMFNGESNATGLRNQANASRYEGDVAEIEGKEKRTAAYLQAAGTLASTAGSMASTYGKFTYPTASGRA